MQLWINLQRNYVALIKLKLISVVALVSTFNTFSCLHHVFTDKTIHIDQVMIMIVIKIIICLAMIFTTHIQDLEQILLTLFSSVSPFCLKAGIHVEVIQHCWSSFHVLSMCLYLFCSPPCY